MGLWVGPGSVECAKVMALVGSKAVSMSAFCTLSHVAYIQRVPTEIVNQPRLLGISQNKNKNYNGTYSSSHTVQ